MSACFGPADGGVLTLDSLLDRASNNPPSGCDVMREGRRTRVRLWGSLPFEWCGNLSLHCRAASVNILDVDARHLGTSRWVASLLVEPKDGAGILESSDFVTMSRHRPGLARSPGPALLDEFQLTPSEANGCALLHLRAPDRIGLLAGVLDAIVRSGLRPRRLSVRTRNGRAEDWLELESAAAAAPTTVSLDALWAQLTTGLAKSGTI
jgi:hypothetical protein